MSIDIAKIENLPRHLAIIPDGNRRWARKKTIASWMGHQKGSESLEGLMDILLEFKIEYFSFWGSSKSNLLKRPKEEVNCLLQIYRDEFNKIVESNKVHEYEVKVNIFGDWREMLPDDVKDPMEKVIEKTKNYKKHFLTFFIGYSGTEEMLQTVERIAKLKMENPDLKIDKELFKSQLCTHDLPPVDFLIRTGGEPHNSDGFMMWDTANAQLFFSEKLWPDFTNKDLKEAILDYAARERRMGK